MVKAVHERRGATGIRCGLWEGVWRVGAEAVREGY